MSTKLVARTYLLPRAPWFFSLFMISNTASYHVTSSTLSLVSIKFVGLSFSTQARALPSYRKVWQYKHAQSMGASMKHLVRNCLGMIVLFPKYRRRGRIKLHRASFWTIASSVLCLSISCALILFQYNCRHKLDIFSKSASLNSWFSLFNKVITIYCCSTLAWECKKVHVAQ